MYLPENISTGRFDDVDAFPKFPKIHRLSREMIITEKLDGTNASIHIYDDGYIRAGSRTRWITPSDDNYGFAKWVEENKEELLKLGPGSHYGEWWGKGIQRNYGLNERRFSLFNVSRWDETFYYDERINGREYQDQVREKRPACCHVVPVLGRGAFDTGTIDLRLWELRTYGSRAAPGFLKPEGVVIFHVASQSIFKKTIDKDDEPKGTVH